MANDIQAEAQMVLLKVLSDLKSAGTIPPDTAIGLLPMLYEMARSQYKSHEPKDLPRTGSKM